ncbi:MAG: terminase large subunit domain-containing protein [Janthinobacterium lividum]
MPTLNLPQARFLAMPQKFRLFVAGFGSGKTWVGGAGLCQHAWEFPKINSGYFAPTYPQIRDIFYPTIDEVAFDWGLRAKVHVSNKEVSLYSGALYRSTIICRTMDNPSNIVGFKIGKGLVDEIDVMKTEKARQAWRKIIARMRYNAPGLKNGIDVTTTPEGFKFVYEQFVKQIRDNPALAELYGMTQASTYENESNLPADYIPSLLASYPPQLIDAYLRGQFVNLTAGSVYPNFDRIANHTGETMRDGEALHIGMDFNVMNMTAIINVIRGGWPRTVGELTGVRDTPTMARMLKERFPKRVLTVYPDASGQAHKSVNASESDLSILRQNNFSVRVDGTNPAVKDRVNAVNAMILNAEGERRWKVNTNLCPRLTEALEQQAYDKNGEPDKTSGQDHPPDAQGYFINQLYPIKRAVVQKIAVHGT